jgi:hypothetical protein
VSSRRPTFICGGDVTPGPRDSECPNALHDWPLPTGYVDASMVAASRLSRGWGNRKCARCGLYGWTPGRINATTDIERPIEAAP